MKKVNIVLFVFLIIVVLTSTTYFTFFYGKDSYDVEEYNKLFNELSNKESFSTPTEFDVTVNSTEKDGDFLVSLKINNFKKVYNDVKFLAIDETKDVNKSYPEINIYEDEDITLVPGNPSGKNQLSGINVSFRSKTKFNKIFIYFSYVENKTRIEEFYEVNVNA